MGILFSHNSLSSVCNLGAKAPTTNARR